MASVKLTEVTLYGFHSGLTGPITLAVPLFRPPTTFGSIFLSRSRQGLGKPAPLTSRTLPDTSTTRFFTAARRVIRRSGRSPASRNLSMRMTPLAPLLPLSISGRALSSLRGARHCSDARRDPGLWSRRDDARLRAADREGVGLGKGLPNYASWFTNAALPDVHLRVWGAAARNAEAMMGLVGWGTLSGKCLHPRPTLGNQ